MLYHCLLIGLQDLELNTQQKLTKEQLAEEIRSALTPRDLNVFDELCLQPSDNKVSEMLVQKLDNEPEELNALREENLRWQIVYEQGSKSRNRFVRDWFAFNLTLNNVLAATICRKHGFDISTAIVGEGPVQDLLRTSNAKDFGLTGEVEEIDEMLKLCTIDDLYEREKKTDALRWAWLEEHTSFQYYELENVLSYWLMAQMLFRWDLLNVDEGTRVFREMIADMKRDVKF
ncbi:MAG: DUF2764 domain-containing protein [Paludibacteraceae bacterium]|nr:DUF2764 domain-containing protein [Paludibacteraceae bacterium]